MERDAAQRWTVRQGLPPGVPVAPCGFPVGLSGGEWPVTRRA